MSAILALRGPAGSPVETSDDELSALLGRMAYRGSELQGKQRSGNAVVAVARDGWESEPGFAGPTLVASRGTIHVVCDATLYYVADLRARLDREGVAPASESAADLIAAAWAAFGPACVDHLEGDFAFCLWDADAGRLFCARDPFGARSLFHARIGDVLAIASTPHPLVAMQGRGADFDPEGILRAVLLRYGDGTRTAWRGVFELPAGHTLSADDHGVELRRYWMARGADRWARLSSQEAVEALRLLLRDAARERGHSGGASLALSGGQDSTAVLASLRHENANPSPLQLLSFRLPDDDPGNEAWYVQRVADSFGVPVHWVEIADLGLYDELGARAAVRSHCHGSPFEGHNRALARAARAEGNRVLLNGHGGDSVMGVGNWAMADLLRAGRLLQLRRYMRARGYRRLSHFRDHCLRPALPVGLFDLLEVVLGRRLCTRPYERPVPPWVRRDDAKLSRIVDADRAEHARTIGRNYRSIEGRMRAWGLMDATFPRSCAASFDLNRDEGVELRMPFYDRRVVEFALSRPGAEFNQPRRVKVLLGEAMRDRLPPRERAPQPGGLKPGTAVGVMTARFPVETRDTVAALGEGGWLSESLGVVDRAAYAERCMRDPLQVASAVDLMMPLFTEAWLRVNDPSAGSAADDLAVAQPPRGLPDFDSDPASMAGQAVPSIR